MKQLCYVRLIMYLKDKQFLLKWDRLIGKLVGN